MRERLEEAASDGDLGAKHGPKRRSEKDVRGWLHDCLVHELESMVAELLSPLVRHSC